MFPTGKRTGIWAPRRIAVNSQRRRQFPTFIPSSSAGARKELWAFRESPENTRATKRGGGGGKIIRYSSWGTQDSVVVRKAAEGGLTLGRAV